MGPDNLEGKGGRICDNPTRILTWVKYRNKEKRLDRVDLSA
jgi:hypothetical protein